MTTLLFRPSGATGITPPAPVPPRSTTGIANALFEISYTDPNDPKEWIDETAYLRRVSFSRGSNDELEQPQTGRLTALVDNRDGRFSPTNTAGAHYPDVLPVRSVRLSAEVASTSVPFTMRRSSVGKTDVLRGASFFDVPLFTGFIEQWPQAWDPSDADATATIDAADGFSILNLPKFRWGDLYNTLSPGPDDWPANATTGNVAPAHGPPFIPDDSPTARILRVLDSTGWPRDRLSIDPGPSLVAGSTNNMGGTSNIPVDETALNYLRNIALSTGGKVFIDPRGNFRYIDVMEGPSSEVYGEAAGEIDYTDIAVSYGLDKVWNAITGSVGFGADGTAQIEVRDAASITRYYERTKSISLLLVLDDDDVPTYTARLDEMLERFKDPHLRITSLSFRPKTGQELRTVLRHDLADAVTVRHQSSGEVIEQASRIDQIEVSTSSPFDWLVTWQLSAI